MNVRVMNRLKWVLKAGALVGLCLVITKAATGFAHPAVPQPSTTATAAQSGHQHQDRRHMHMRNWALEPTPTIPFPSGDPNDPGTTRQVMRFDVQNSQAVHPRPLPAKLIDIPELVETYKETEKKIASAGAGR